MPLQLISALGLVAMLVFAWALSRNRREFPWRTVLWGLALQFLFALFILRTPFGGALFSAGQRAIDRLNLFALEGAKMVFGPLADGAALRNTFGPANSYIFAVSVSATIIVVSALSSLFYHWGILQRVVHAMASVMRRAMRTSGSESLAAASNIFLGQTEAALLVKPYISSMTMSELMALMTTGMATIASGVMIVYAQLGFDAGHLLTASVLSAPAGLLVAKIMFPETDTREIRGDASDGGPRTTVNSIDALCRGAGEGIALAINVLGMLIAFVAAVALANYLFSLLQRSLGVADPFTLQNLLGYVNWPLAWLMGIPAKDCQLVAQALGERVVLNEFIGYLSLSQQKAQLDARSFTIATYALCGFANFSSIAIQIGGIGALAPERRSDLARLGLRAMVGGLIACYLTATVVGIII